MTVPEVTVVIPALDAEATLGDQLEALSIQDGAPAFEVIVADNGSRDGTTALVEQWSHRVPGLRVVDASHRRGVSAARNAGWRGSGGRFILFCDADDVVDRHWVANMSLGLGGAPIVGGRFELHSLNTQPRRPSHESGVYVEGRGSYAVGASAGFRREVLETLGGFDESWDGGGSDDAEICFRAARLGWQVHEVRGAVVSRRIRNTRFSAVKQYYRYGRELARLRRAFPDLVPRRGPREVTVSWLGTIRRLPSALVSTADLRGVEYLGLLMGRVRGSIAHRVWNL